MSDHIDQTAFSSDQPFADQSLSHAGQTGGQDPEQKKKNPFMIIVALVVLVLILVVGAFLLLKPSGTEQSATPTPQATQSPRLGGGLLEEIEPLLNDAKTGNPDENKFPVPPVRFELYIQD